MKATNLKSNKMLFALLFAALSVDLVGRLQISHPTISTDLASESNTPVARSEASSAERACATSLIQSMNRSGNREGTCELNYEKDQATVTAVVTRSNREAPENLNWIKPTDKSALIAEPSAPDYDKECPATKTMAATKKTKAKTVTLDATEVATCKQAKEKIYTQDLQRVREKNEKASAAKLGEEILLVNFNTELLDCADCQVTGSLVLSKSATPMEIAKAILAEGRTQVARIKKQRVELEAKLKADAEKKIAAEKLEKDKENCLRGDDGKALGASARLACDKSKLDGLEGAEAAARFAKVRSQLNQWLVAGNPEERASAMALSEEISNNAELPRDIRETARVMQIAGKYNSQILAIGQSLANAPANSQARMQGMYRLQQLNQQMQMELGSAANTLGQRGLQYNSGAYQELQNWNGILSNNLSLAVSNPSSLNGTSASGIIDPNTANRVGSGNAAVDAALQQQQKVVNGLTGVIHTPGIPGQVITSQYNGFAGAGSPAGFANGRQMVPMNNGAINNNGAAGIPGAPVTTRGVF